MPSPGTGSVSPNSERHSCVQTATAFPSGPPKCYTGAFPASTLCCPGPGPSMGPSILPYCRISLPACRVDGLILITAERVCPVVAGHPNSFHRLCLEHPVPLPQVSLRVPGVWSWLSQPGWSPFCPCGPQGWTSCCLLHLGHHPFYLHGWVALRVVHRQFGLVESLRNASALSWCSPRGLIARRSCSIL